jgi:hypothetical protein
MNIYKQFRHFLSIIWSVIIAYIIVAWVVILLPFQLPSLQKSWSIDLPSQEYIPLTIILTVGVILFYRCYQWVCNCYRYYYFANCGGKISVFIGITLFWGIDFITTIITSNCCFRILCLVMSIISFCFILFCCCHRLQRQNKKDKPIIIDTDADTDITQWSPKQILEWAKKEEPIDRQSQDYFDMTTTAKRIADIIKNIKNGESNQNGSIPNCSIGLMGKFGSGKTTLINLVKEQLNENLPERYIFCCVSCWGFSTSVAALQFILDQIITTIAEAGINTDSIQGLPTKYLRVITGDSAWWERLSKVFISEFENTPETILSNLIKVLQKEKCHLILIIEDIDRNEPKHFSVEDIFAALQNFKNVKGNLSLILAGLPYKEDLRIDFEKLCDHIITVPYINIDMIINIFKIIISYHSTQFSHDVKLDDHLIPSNENCYDRNINHFIKNNFLMDVYNGEQGSISYDEAFRLLMERVTPRTLKHIIRHFDSAWKNLHGECDYVELLLLTILRYAANDLFGFILHNIEDLRLARNTTPNTKRLVNEIENISNSNNRLDRNVVIYWLNFLFSGINHLLNSSKTQSSGKKYARQIAYSSPVDYFKRILNETLSDNEISDQKILHAIQNWNNNNNTQELVDLLSECQYPEDNRCERWFCALQDDERILDLTRDVILKKLRQNMEFDEGCRILFRAWYPTRTQHFGNLVEWFKNIFSDVFPYNIKFVADIYWHFACTHDISGARGTVNFLGLPPFDSPKYKCLMKDINFVFMKEAHKQFKDAKNIVRRCFQNEFRSKNLLDYLLRQYCKEFNGDAMNGSFGDAYHKASAWHWLALKLLEGLQSQDDDTRNKIYLLTIMHLIGEFNTEPDNNQHHYSFFGDQFLNLMFGDNVGQLMELLSNFEFSDNISGFTHGDCTLVQNAAKEWLQTNSNPPQDNSSNE